MSEVTQRRLLVNALLEVEELDASKITQQIKKVSFRSTIQVLQTIYQGEIY